MLNNLRIRRRINRELRDTEAHYAPKLKTAKGEDYAALQHAYQQDLRDCTLDLWYLDTQDILRRASRYNIDCSNPDWFMDRQYTMGNRILTHEAQMELQRLISSERRARAEWWVTKIIVPILQVFISIIATLIGLVAILKK